MGNPKVFEFAKEKGIETLALMDKIKQWGLPVKSHMAELEPNVIEAINEKLASESAPKKKVAKKTTTRKKKKTVAKKTTTKKASGKTATEEAAPVAKKSKTVIRRKAKTDEELKAEAAAAAAAEEAKNRELAAAAEAAAAPAEPQGEVAEPAPSSATPEETSGEAAPAVAASEAAAEPAKEKAPAPKVVQPKNIVGKIDLSRVAARERSFKGRSDGGDRGTTGAAGQRQAPRPSRTAPRNLRPGFVAPTPFELAQADATKGREDRPRRPKVAAPPPAAKKEEEQVPSFNTSEFRKREIVFQPKKKRIATGPSKKTELTTPKASKRIVRVHGSMTTANLAQEMGLKVPALMKALMKAGVLVKIHDNLDFETISLIAPEFGFEAENVKLSVEEIIAKSVYGDLDKEPVERPPVVTVMGHVDHGKTSLLDAIRKADVVSGEAGGITQHIGAYSVQIDTGAKITFIDTPGHEAFTAMRARGANVTDIAIIVVAADDGVMPQTEEAINHAKAAGVPIIVAVNKIDKPDANADKVKQQLTEHELVPEDWGGDTIFCPVSAIEKTGIPELLEQISLVAEIQELKANPAQSATGIVIESKMEKGKGAVATLLIRNGTLKQGDYVVAGAEWGKVRSLINDRGERVKEAGPSVPVEILGLAAAPKAGDRFDGMKDDTGAKEVADFRVQEQNVAANKTPSSKMSLEDLFAKVKVGDMKELPVVLKTDVAGSGEAIQGMFSKLETDEVKVKVIHTAVGGISESDVLLASTAKGLILGFNVRPDSSALAAADKEGVEIRTYGIVYELIDEIKQAMAGLLDPDIVEKTVGHAEIRETFSVPKMGVIGGASVQDGRVNRADQVRLLRDGRVIFQGKIGSLRRFKDDVKEVASGYECGIGIENFNDLKVGDVVEAFVEEQVAREL